MMNKIEALNILEEEAKNQARNNFLKFILYTKPDYQINWHHRVICNYLEKFISGDLKRLMIFTPPQHGKSQLVSRSLPSYILGKDPNRKIVLSSYSNDLSSTFNRDCQRIIDSSEYNDLFPETKLNGSNIVTVSNAYLRNSDIFQIVGYQGYLKTTGVGTSLTGTTADLCIIDDPVKDSIEASSPTYQMRNWNWYNDVLYTRINNKTGILITQTRWDENDLSGLLIKAMNEGRGEPWTILSLPAIKVDDFNNDDPRDIGDALWPEWHSLEKLHIVQKQNTRTFQSLYQQNPRPTETGGEAYKQFKIYRNLKDFEYNPDLPIHISFDFNVNPGMHAVVFQIQEKICYQIAEIITRSPRNNTKGICNEFKRLYRGHNGGLFIYGDPSGRNASTREEIGHNDYSIILNELQGYHPQLRVPYAHPSVKMRLNFLNTIFESGFDGIEIWLRSTCPATVADFQLCKEDVAGNKLKEKARDLATGVNYEKYGHLSDAVDYMICEAFKAEYTKYQNPNSLIQPGGIFQVPRRAKITF